MVFEHEGVPNLFFEFGEGIPEFGSVLLDDRGVRDDVDDALQIVLPGVTESKCQGGERFAATGGNGERE